MNTKIPHNKPQKQNKPKIETNTKFEIWQKIIKRM